MAFPPVEGVEIDCHFGQGAAGGAGESQNLFTAGAFGRTHAGRSAARALDQDEIADDDRDADLLVPGVAEVLPGRGGHEIQARRERFGQIRVGVVVAIIGRLGQVGWP